MIIAGDRYALTEKENNMYAIEMILHIKRLQLSDFGGYKCISKNSIGDTEGTIRLYEMERPGHVKKILRDDDLNEVSKNEVVQKDSRSEDGSRNLNGRLYKERAPDQHPASGSGPVLIRGTMRLIGTFLLALLALLTATAMAKAGPTLSCHTKGGRQKKAKKASFTCQQDGDAVEDKDEDGDEKKDKREDGQAEKWRRCWERSTQSWRRATPAE
uniref:Uncharacterized protein LOC108039495 n=1 Tax=Drosophila rhopaloa TaxID=1041015 RepID=A0A6P4EF92_DRORH